MSPLTLSSLRQKPKTAVMVLNPRRIPYCMAALQALQAPKLWLSFMTEIEAAREIGRAIEGTAFDRYVLISDDCEPTQAALDAVLAMHDEGHPVVTGYSNFDAVRDEATGAYTAKLPFVNLCTNRLDPPPPGAHSYVFMTRAEVDAMPDAPIATTFTGLSFTCMSRDMWLQFPARTASSGGQMDYQLSHDLQRREVPIVAAKGGFVWHCKDEFGVYPDKAPEKALLVGVEPSAVTWTDLDRVSL